MALGLIAIAFLGLPPAAAWLFLIVSAGLHTLYWFTLMKGYDAGDLSHVYTLARGSAPLLVALGAAFAANEIPGGVEMAGIPLISVGVLCVGFSPRAPLRATLWALAMGACIASYSLVDALGARVAGSAALFISGIA
jgi:drug/metabolite transporter (DMT)-like permease